MGTSQLVKIFADDQILQTKSEDRLQYSAHSSSNMAAEFSIVINVEYQDG
jgi:hypothetical protein